MSRIGVHAVWNMLFDGPATTVGVPAVPIINGVLSSWCRSTSIEREKSGSSPSAEAKLAALTATLTGADEGFRLVS